MSHYDYCSKNYVNWSDVVAAEFSILKARLAAASKSHQILYHVIPPYNSSDQKEYDVLVTLIVQKLKDDDSRWQLGGAKVTNKTGPQLMCIVIKWSEK